MVSLAPPGCLADGPPTTPMSCTRSLSIIITFALAVAARGLAAPVASLVAAKIDFNPDGAETNQDSGTCASTWLSSV